MNLSKVTAVVLPFYQAQQLKYWGPSFLGTGNYSNNNRSKSKIQQQDGVEVVSQEENNHVVASSTTKNLFPAPRLHPGKIPPSARYTGQCLDNPLLPVKEGSESTSTTTTTTTTTTWSWSRHCVDVHLDLEDSSSHNVTTTPEEEEEHDYFHKGGPYEPAGQHLLIDIQHVSPRFLLDT